MILTDLDINWFRYSYSNKIVKIVFKVQHVQAGNEKFGWEAPSEKHYMYVFGQTLS
jgi:hypothetical protein